ncbi:MAG TPA: MJ0042-type zinc finger domain-containing protein [Hyphomicrobiales bacterium]|nr:MJ0042-type zinc finger domain-containing protein [Hyphomicrobiales bacterium]
MLVVCPSCSASYRLSAAALGANGRTVRCAACRTTWFVAPDAAAEPAEEVPPLAAAAAPAGSAEAAVPAVAEPFAETRPARPSLHLVEGPGQEPPADRPALRARRRPPRLAAPKSMRVQLRPTMLVVVMGALVFGGGLIWRKSVVGLFPQTAPLYRAVGLPVNLRGLAFRDVQSAETIENGTPMLHISGRIENVTQVAADVPRLRLAVRGVDGREIYVWTVMPGKSRLAAGESLPFRAELASPPAAGREIAVRFLTARDLTASLNDKADE